jgi:hypothetical protein
MMRRLPFKDGVFDRETFRSYSESYLKNLAAHYKAISEKPRLKAVENGDAIKVRDIDSRTEKMVGEATRYVHDTARGMASTLDPEGTGTVKKKDARRKLEGLASLADGNGDGVLDGYEAAIAEAAFAKGVDLSKPGAYTALDRELDPAAVRWND